MRDDFEAWVKRARAVPIEHELNRRGVKLKRVGAERIGPCPKCGGDDRFALNTKKAVFNCRGCGVGGDVIELVQHLDGVDFTAACTTLAGQPPRKTNGKGNSESTAGTDKVVVASFEYQNADGSVAFAVDRVELQSPDGSFVLKDGKHEKTFRQRRPDPDHPGAWLHNVDGVPVVPYRLPRLLETVAAGRPVLVVEGEAKADLLWSWDVAATCCVGGAKKWKPEFSEFLRGADVFLLPDNDNAGWEHAHKVGASLSATARSIRVVALPDLPLKGDIIDWEKAGGTREKLDELLSSAPIWRLPTADEQKDKARRQETELIEALAQKSGLDFARERSKLAKELGVSARAIDTEVRAHRDKTAPLYGHWIVEPWPEPAEGDSLLRDIIVRLRRHVVCSHDDALAIALWIKFAWVHDEAATHSPILDITSAEPESGKTTTLGLISFLAPRCLSSVEISEAALFRSIELWQPSFAIDEFDVVLASDEKAGLRAIVNSGHTRGQGIVRCVEPDYRPQMFKTFAPKAIGMVGRKMPASTLSRCIIVELRRRRQGERVEKFAHKDDAGLVDLRSRLLRWSLDNADTLRGAKPSMPGHFDNRRADNWTVLLAIADLAGEDWGDKARAAAVKVEGNSDTRTVTVLLLAAIRQVFDGDEDNKRCDAISSQQLCERLAADLGSEWAEWGRARKPISQKQLANMLKEHRIRPGQVRAAMLGKEQQIRGYYRWQFEDAWSTYL
jgi:hypothetical protein